VPHGVGATATEYVSVVGLGLGLDCVLLVHGYARVLILSVVIVILPFAYTDNK